MKNKSYFKEDENKKKAAVVLSSGIGNAVLMVPLLKILKSSNFHVSIFLSSVFLNKEFLICNDFPCDTIIELPERKGSLFAINNFQRFDSIYLDYSSSSVKNIFFSCTISKNVYANREKRFPLPNLKYREEKRDTHAAIMNIQLFVPDFSNEFFDLKMMQLEYKKDKKPDLIEKIEASGKMPVFVQPSSSNMTARYKNWPVSYWNELLKKIHEKFPELVFILSGDKNEMEIGKILQHSGYECVNLIGKTSLDEACALLFYSRIYAGLDSGFMHLAAAYGIPSFSIFGASSFSLFGYEQFSPGFHRTIVNDLDCWPCLAYQYKNISRVKNPADCPDQKCLTGLDPSKVFEMFTDFYNKLVTKLT